MAPRESISRLHARSARKEIAEPIAGTSQAHDLELKRLRGEVPCAECKRLKIKCDRQVPCSSCRRRGCGKLCPNDHLSTGEGTRFAAVAEDLLRKRIVRMTAQVRQLEDALRNEQALTPEEPHPVLAGGDFHVSGLRGHLAPSSVKDDLGLDVVADAMGTLLIAEDGSQRYFGRSSGPLLLMSVDNVSRASAKSRDYSRAARDDMDLPFEGPPEVLLAAVHAKLPPYDEAQRLMAEYAQGAHWLVLGASRAQVTKELLPGVYGQAADTAAAVTHARAGSSGAHAHALFFALLAGTALVKQPRPDLAQADSWIRLAQAALVVRSVLEGPSLLTVQALHALARVVFMRQNGRDELASSYLATAVHLSISMGLCRDPAKFDLPPDVCERRRSVFWTLFMLEGIQAVLTGRPSTYSLHFIDCQLSQEGLTVVSNGTAAKSDNLKNRFMFSVSVVTDVGTELLPARPTAFTRVMEVDRQIRQSEPTPLTTPQVAPGSPVHWLTTQPVSDIGFVCLHRLIFVETLAGPIEDPCTGPHARSIRNCLQSAYTVSTWFLEQNIANPTFTDAAWHSWAYGLSASFILGGLAAYRPRVPAAVSALHALERITHAFELGANRGVGGAINGLPALARLRAKARAAAHTGFPASWDGDTDDLLIFGGRVKVLQAKKPTVAGPPTPPAESHHELYPVAAWASVANVMRDGRLATGSAHDTSLSSVSRQPPPQLRIPADTRMPDVGYAHPGHVDILVTASSSAPSYDSSDASFASGWAQPAQSHRTDSSLLDPRHQSHGASQAYALSAPTSPAQLYGSTPVHQSTAYAFAPPSMSSTGETLTSPSHSSPATGSTSAHSFYAATPLLDSTTYSFPLGTSAVPSHSSPQTAGGSSRTRPATPHEHAAHHASSATALDYAGGFDYEALGFYAAPFPAPDQHRPSSAEYPNFSGYAPPEYPGIIPGFGCPVAAASCDVSAEKLLHGSASYHGSESPSVPPLTEACHTPYYATPPHTASQDYTGRGSVYTQSAISGHSASASAAAASATDYPFAYGAGIPNSAAEHPAAFAASTGDYPFAYAPDADPYPLNDTCAGNAYSAASHTHSVHPFATSQAEHVYYFSPHQVPEPRNAYPQDHSSTSV